MKENGVVKWWQLVTAFFSLIAIIVTVSIFGAEQVIAVDLRAGEKASAVEARAVQRYNENRALIIDLLKSNNESHTAIIGDIRELKTLVRGIK